MRAKQQARDGFDEISPSIAVRNQPLMPNHGLNLTKTSLTNAKQGCQTSDLIIQKKDGLITVGDGSALFFKRPQERITNF